MNFYANILKKMPDFPKKIRHFINIPECKN